jgi:YVTN family beta-propeller protein
VIDTAANAVVATIPVGASPLGVAVSADGRAAYVTNYSGSSVSIIDTATLQVLSTISLGTGLLPGGVAVTADGTKVLIAIQSPASDRRVFVFDRVHGQLRSLQVGQAPFGIATHPTQPLAYVANQLSKTVSVIDTDSETVVDTISGFSLPFSVAVNRTGTRLYVGDVSGDFVREIDTSTLQTVFTYSAVRPFGIAVHPAGDRFYVSNITQNRVSVFQTVSHTVSTVTVGTSPFGISIKPEGDRVYVANSGSNTVSVIDTATNAVVATIPVQQNPKAFGLFIRPAVGAPGE